MHRDILSTLPTKASRVLVFSFFLAVIDQDRSYPGGLLDKDQQSVRSSPVRPLKAGLTEAHLARLESPSHPFRAVSPAADLHKRSWSRATSAQSRRLSPRRIQFRRA